jgi:hypothetical protein
MKGQPIPLLVPRRGLQRSELPHRVAADTVVEGRNMILTLDGRYGCRPGMSQYGNASIQERIMGGIFLRDITTNPRFVLGGPTSWYTYMFGPDSWISVGDPADPLTADQTTPVRFVSYFQQDAVWVLGCNGTDQMKRWEPTLTTYVNVPASVPAVDMAVVANRVVSVNTIEAGIRHPDRVRWTAEADATLHPPLAFIDLDNAGEPIVGIRTLSRTTAAIYRTQSIWLLAAQAGGDATAFVPELIATGIDGPVSPAAVVPVGRSHYYLGRDAKVYRFDGVEPVEISEPIDRLLDDVMNAAYGPLAHGSLFVKRRQIWWWVTTKDETEPRSAFVFNLDTEQWEVEQRFQIGVTASIRGEEQRADIWDTDEATWDSDESTWNAELAESTLIMLLGSSDGRVFDFGRDVSDAGEPIDFAWTLPVIYAGESNQLLLDEVESFFVALAETVTEGPTINVRVYGMQHPVGERTLIFSGVLDLLTLERLVLSSGDTEFDTTNYYPALQVEYDGVTSDSSTVEWAGGTLIVYPETDG